MRLTTKGQYGVKAMVDLAQHRDEGPISLKNVAKRQDISEHYLEQLAGGLRKAGLIKSVRGVQGGYVLAKEPEEIRIGDIIRALEGPIAPVGCVSEGQQTVCQKARTCRTRPIWEKVRDSIAEVVDAITLAEAIKDEEIIQQTVEEG
ncbi:MAG: Rrf2 family transcriptional regulator [Peptococcaceae bacterium]|jgi:Rrf2 family protein|nr:Rrf2 family transcriptional regulator [Peptococcaceae bacterium]